MKKFFIYYKILMFLYCIQNQNIESIDYLTQTNLLFQFPEYTKSEIKETLYGIIVAYFNPENENVALEEKDQQNNLIKTIIFHANGTKTIINHEYKTIEFFNADHTIKSRTEYNDEGKTTSITNFNLDKSQVKTTFNQDKTKTINYFNEQGNNNKRVKIDNKENLIETIDIYNDETFAKTIHRIDKSSTKELFNKEGLLILMTERNEFGYQISANTELLTAWHEAGHSLSSVYNCPLNLVQHVTIQSDTATKSHGHVKSIRIDNIERTIEHLENDIISALCGGVGEQILLHQKMLTDHTDIINYFNHQRFRSDIELARKDARKIFSYNWPNLSEAEILQKTDHLLVKLYFKAYQFIYAHQNDMKKIADKLILQKFLSSDETYDIINAEKPFIYYE